MESTATYEYTICKYDGGCRSAGCHEIDMIEAGVVRWIESEDTPDGTEFARLDFGGEAFTVWRKQVS